MCNCLLQTPLWAAGVVFCGCWCTLVGCILWRIWQLAVLVDKWQVDMSQLIGFHFSEFSNFRLWIFCETPNVVEYSPQNGTITHYFCDLLFLVCRQLHYVAYGAEHSKVSQRGITAECAGYRRVWSFRSTWPKNRLCGK